MKHHNKHEQPRYTREKRFVAVLAAAGALGSAALASCSTEATSFRVGDPNGHSVSLDEFEDGVMPINSHQGRGFEMTEKERFNLPPEEYYKIDEFLRASDQAEYFYQFFDEAYEDILASYQLTPEENALFYKPDLNKPRSQWSEQDYANFHTIATFFATGQDNQNVAKQSASVVARPGSKTFANIEEWIDNNPGVGHATIYRAIPTPLTGKELSVGGGVYDMPITEAGGRLVGLEAVNDSSVSFSVFINRTDSSGHIISVNVLTANTVSDSSLDSIISQNS